MSGRSTLLSWGLPLVGATALAAGVYLVAANRPVGTAEKPPRPPITPPAPAADGSGFGHGFIGALGVSEPPGEPIAIAAHVAGIVESVDAVVGRDVHRGDVLFRVDGRRAAAEVAAQQAQVEAAAAEMASLRATIPTRDAAVASAQAALHSTEARAAEAEADLADRTNKLRLGERLLKTAVISTEEVDNRRFAVQQAEARVATARASCAEARAMIAQAKAELARLADSKTGAPGPDVVAAEKRVSVASRELAKAETDLQQLTVTSPIDGRILQVNIHPGEFAPASVPTEGLVVLGHTGATHLRVQIDEVDIPRFRPNGQAWASPRGNSSVRLPLKLAFVEPLVVPKTGLSGRSRDIIDTRVLQVVYEVDGGYESPGIGQQFDVFIQAADGGSRAFD
jgi:multidrug resistance efflux pump